jgi:hypothetical protein
LVTVKDRTDRENHLTIFSSRRRETSQVLRGWVCARRGSKSRYAS